MRTYALAVVLVAALAGCGGDSLSRSEWASQANAICLETLEKIEALGQPANSDAYLRVTPKANRLGRDAIDRLRELEPPEEIERDAGEMINGYDKVIELQEQVYHALKAQREGREVERSSVRASNEALEVGQAADAIAERLRARDCARDPWQAPSQT